MEPIVATLSMLILTGKHPVSALEQRSRKTLSSESHSREMCENPKFFLLSSKTFAAAEILQKSVLFKLL